MADHQKLTKPLNQSNDTALYDAISRGMVVMRGRNMRFAPDQKDIGRIASILVQDLKAIGKTDPAKIAAALDELGRTEEEWPSTARIIRQLKNRQHGPTLGLPYQPYKEKELTGEERANIQKLIAKCREKLEENKPSEAELLETARGKFNHLNDPDLSKCPQCGGPADNGHDRLVPPNPYNCSKCESQPERE